jgi:hypothetical protein
LDWFDEVSCYWLLQGGQLLKMNEVRSTVRHQQLCRLGLVRAVPHIDVKLRGLQQIKTFNNKITMFPISILKRIK